MSITAQNIINQINLYVRQDPVRSYQNMRLNSILLQLCDFIDSISAGGGSASSGPLQITSANFINATDCPLIALDGENLVILFDDRSNTLKKGIDYIDLVGGGFSVIIPGFDATANSYLFYVWIQSN